jgi:hypothetical protein
MIKISDIKVHIRSLHGCYSRNWFGLPRPFKCFKCNEALVSEDIKSTHVCVHQSKFIPDKVNPWDKYVCDVDGCGAEFDEKVNYRKHLQIVHMEVRVV